MCGARWPNLLPPWKESTVTLPTVLLIGLARQRSQSPEHVIWAAQRCFRKVQVSTCWLPTLTPGQQFEVESCLPSRDPHHTTPQCHSALPHADRYNDHLAGTEVRPGLGIKSDKSQMPSNRGIQPLVNYSLPKTQGLTAEGSNTRSKPT